MSSSESYADFRALARQREDVVRRLLQEAFSHIAPTEYHLSTDPADLVANSCAVLKSNAALPRSAGIFFFYLNPYHTAGAPSLESIVAMRAISSNPLLADSDFGQNGRFATRVWSGDLAFAVRDTVALVCASEPLTHYEWVRCAENVGMFNLMGNKECFDTMWRNGREWVTSSATSYDDQGKAKAAAENAAFCALTTRHAEQLAMLGVGGERAAPELKIVSTGIPPGPKPRKRISSAQSAASSF